MHEVFSSFDEVPIASASLGQVHKACLTDGDCIVVKVQYPGIEEVIAADIRTLRFVISILRLLYRHINLDVIYSEFSRIVYEELDYLQEGKNAETFARNFAKNPRIKIPIVYWPFTTSKVLTLEYLEGIKITDFEEIDARGIDRKEVARTLAEAYCQMFFVDGLFHGDPHPGNIFVRPGPEVILVDFGMVDRISAPKNEGLRSAFTAIMDRDALGLVRALVDMGFIPLTKDIQPLVQFIERILQKYRDISPSEFKAMDIDEIGNDIIEALQLSPSIQIPNDFILFGRVVGMLNGLGSQLDAETNIIEIATPFAKRFIKAEEFTRSGLLKQTVATGRALVKLPKLLADFLVTTSRGETRVEITSRDIVNELRNIYRIGKGFILSMLTVGLGAGALILRINHYPAESAWTAVGAGVLFVWLALGDEKIELGVKGGLFVKKKVFVLVVAIAAMLFLSGSSLACDFCLLSQGMSPLDTMKGSGIKVSERYTVLDQVYQGTSEKANPGAKEVHWTTELTGFYGITPEFTILAVLPYKKGKTSGEADLTVTPAVLDASMAGEASGLGDVALLGRYSFFKSETPNTTTVMAGLAGVKFATGATNAKTADGMSYLDSHMQAGTGSTDYLLGLSYSHSLQRLSLSANMLGTITTEGKFGNTTHEFGNALNYDASGKYRIAPEAFTPTEPQVFAALGVNGEVRQREKEAGVAVPDSGGNTIYLSPGLQLVMAPHWIAEASFQHAIYHKLNGTQLGETYKAITGVTYLF